MDFQPTSEIQSFFPGQEYGHFWPRLAAWLIDVIIVGVINLLLSLLFRGYLGILLVYALDIAYPVYFIGKQGATPGKQLLGLRVVTESGLPMTYGRAFLREILGKIISGLFLCLGYLWIAWDERKQGWHDKIAGTLVIQE